MCLFLKLIVREVGGVVFLSSFRGRNTLFTEVIILHHVRVRSVHSIIEDAVFLSSDFHTRSMGTLMVPL